MGNDGGDIPRRKQLVKQKKKVEVANSQSIAQGRSRYCNLTNERMKQPLAVCRLGCIYNYQNILQALVKKTLPEKYTYIKKLSDIKKVKIQKTVGNSLNFFMCPITKLEYNGFNKFVALWKCGHILSRKAFKQIKVQSNNKEQNTQQKCIICNQQYKNDDVIDLNLEPKQLQQKRKQLIFKINKKKQQKQSLKQDKQIEALGNPQKKVKKQQAQQIYLNKLQRLGGQFNDVIRQRQKFKQLFSKNTGE